MRANFGIAICVFLSSVLITFGQPDECKSDDNSAKQSAKAVNNLAIKLYQKITGDKNVIYSPASIALALALVQSGASGSTRSEIQRLLNPPGSNSADSSQLYQALQKQLQVQTDQAKVTVANGFFYADGIRFKQQYVDNLQRCFQAKITKQPFKTKPEDARKEINKFVSDATAQKIPELFKSGSIDPDTAAVLANAIYFKAEWDEKFHRSEDATFYKGGKSDQKQNVPFMVQSEKFAYAASDNEETIELPYFRVPFSMYIVLPKQRDGVKALEQSLTADKLTNLVDQVQYRDIDLKLPKFTIRLEVKLKEVLQQVGINNLFSNQANLSRMAEDPLKVSDAVHEAYIKVNENGTEAAAATGFKIVPLSARIPQQPVPFVADHPFIFAIVHKPTKAIVFLGKVNSIE